ncbi:Zn-dependent hydrolases [Pyrenophora tritici-repentis Pt-1C-BFP]|uniref:Zn-dependent hydrolases n=1 Tax=Pyrenophora tritici-repentis (strain Pt-1C-BFP) TaxID=426418 RepID=B2WC35_PYRTR|nr:Zn-dependent hydrolases [Pyrenophora tritici-repentis Pt-1C-BFP]EDU50463.1 Zn-dependent hydrolases [Pyrenophora tritici-repentis Pt-1C-BFP]
MFFKMNFEPSDLAICETLGVLDWKHGLAGTLEDVVYSKFARRISDPRQYVPATGQTWTSLHRSQALQKNNFETDPSNPNIHYITTAPLSPSELPPGLADTSSTRKQLGIGQRAILLQTSGGNVLWDCVAFLNPDTISFINSKGGIKAIVISHPHFYTTHLEWAGVFKCPVYMAGVDQEWLNRADKDGMRKFFGAAGGETQIGEVGRESGFKNAKHIPDTTSYTFMWAYPNMIPLTPKAILGIWKAIKGLDFDSTYGGFPGQNLIRPDLKAQVLESMKIFLRRGGHEGAEVYGESV